MIKVIVLGSGNVGFHLTKAFLSSKDVELVQVYSRNLDTVDYLQNKVPITNRLSHLLDADIYIIAISDSAISKFSSTVQTKNKLVVHTSGSVNIDALKNTNKGIFYPLQSFSKQRDLSFTSVPICIETNIKEDLILLEKLASSISNEVYIIDSEKRKKIHLAAVFVNNFVNHLYEVGKEICDTNNIPFEILQPLIKETAEKIKTCSPANAQTGPAVRNDQETIQKQLLQLNADNTAVYNTLTQSILKKHRSNGD